MRITKNWKHTTKNDKQYGKRNVTRYESPFMTLDEEYLEEEDEESEV